MTVRVVIVDGRAVVRRGLAMLICSSDGFEVVGEAGDGAEALAQVAEHRPDVVLMDLDVPRTDGVEATRRLNRLPRPPGVVLLGVSGADDRVPAALRAGACGFLLKDLSPDELSAALQTVAVGGRVLSPAVLASLVRRAAERTPIRINGAGEKLALLSESERRVLALVGEGMTNAQIACTLQLSGPSVKTCVSRILAKLGLGSRTQAAIIAYEAGIAGPGALRVLRRRSRGA